jgi:hypothetical protein
MTGERFPKDLGMPSALPIRTVRRADWLDGRRVVGYSLVVLAVAVAAAAVWYGLSEGLVDPAGHPVGTDFASFYTAGRLALEGDPAAAYDWAAHHAAQRALFGAEAPYYSWFYPPPFLFLTAALAGLPYPAALALWLGLTFAPFLYVVWRILPRPETLLVAAAFPAVLINMGHGQNGFLTAALLGGALLALGPRPILAGLLIGALAYKPQFGLLLPLALAAGGHWRAFAAAAATVTALAGLSLAAHGPEAWAGFLENSALARTLFLEQGGTGWHKMQSVFAAVRLWGGPVGLAYAAQAATALAAAALVWRLWRRPAGAGAEPEPPSPMACAGLVLAALLATPFVFDYDLALLALPIAWLTAEGLRNRFRDWEKIALLAAWTVPLASRGAVQLTAVPLGLAVLAMLTVFVAARGLSPGAAGGAAGLPACPRAAP